MPSVKNSIIKGLKRKCKNFKDILKWLKYQKIIDSFEINVFSDQFPSMKWRSLSSSSFLT